MSSSWEIRSMSFPKILLAGITIVIDSATANS